MATSIRPVSSPAKTNKSQTESNAEPTSGSATDSTTLARQFDLGAHEWYLNRELTWLGFNRRVLHMAESEDVPLLERVKYLAIVSSNLDEFFMKRIGGLKQQIAAGIRTLSVDGRSPARQVEECHAEVRDIHKCQKTILQDLREHLKEQGIEIVQYTELGDSDRAGLREHFIANIFPCLHRLPWILGIRSPLYPILR